MIDAPQIPPGTVIDGYTVGSLVRTRSGAATHDATDSSGQAVHLTLYASSCFPSSLVLERALRELRQLQGVDVPQMVRVLASGKVEAGPCAGGIYEVNEFVIGKTADQLGALGEGVAAQTVSAVGEALLAAQKVGVIHRNLGPNTVVGSGAQARVFGFAVGEPQPRDGASGSLSTMAPEQVQGRVVDQRSLIYNLAALTHQLITGFPVYGGDAASVMGSHEGADVPGNVHTALARGLSKDPRSRPMMLKQFLSELAAIGGAAAPVAGAPPVGGPAVSGAPGPAPKKPSTRGWTMFMEASEAEAPSAAPVAPTPAAPVAPAAPAAPAAPVAPTAPGAAAPAAAAPAAGQAPGQKKKPSTRGWTMFMDAADAEDPAESAAPAAPTPTPTPTAAPTPAAPPTSGATGEKKPSTRGWTMFMDAADAEPEGAAAAPPAAAPTPAAPTPAAPAAPSAPVTPAPTAPPAAAGPAVTPPAAGAPAPTPAVPGGEKKPSTRGWTMFMDAADAEPEGAPAATPDAAAPPAPAAPATPTPAQAAQTTATSADSSTRGWTMFMDNGSPAPGQSPAAGQPQQPAPTPEPAPSQQPAAQAPTDAAAAPAEPAAEPTTRGWTMFMEAPLPKQEGAPAGAQPQQPQPEPTPAAPASEPEAAVGASDAKGWTVFVDSSDNPMAGQQVAQGPMGFAQDGGGQAAPAQQPGPAADGGKRTIVAGAGFPAPASPPAEGGTSKTVFAQAGDQPDTMYFKTGQTEPERIGPQNTEDTPVQAAASPAQEVARPAEAVAAAQPAQDMVAPGRSAPIVAAEESSGGNKTVMMIIIGGVLLAVVIVVLIYAL